MKPAALLRRSICQCGERKNFQSFSRNWRCIKIFASLLCLAVVSWLLKSITYTSSNTLRFDPHVQLAWRIWNPPRQNSTTYYLHTFRSIFISEPSDQESTLSREGNPFRVGLPDIVKDSRASQVENKVIVMYNMPHWIEKKSNSELFGQCPVTTCSLSTNYDADGAKAAAVVFYDAHANTAVPRRAFAEQLYVFFMIEPPPIAPSAYRRTPWNSAFNWTWTYRPDADIWTPYFFLERSKQIPSRESLREVVRKKQKAAAWFVSNCDLDQSLRREYADRLQKVFPVDVYGRCGNKTCTIWAHECDAMLTNYYFYLSFENSFCQDYVTEKYSRAFINDVYVVPVVRGGLNYTHHFPEGTFIDANAYSSPEELGQYLRQLMSDEEKYVDMLWRIAHFTTGGYHDSYRYSWCQFCSKLHTLQVNAKTYPDLFQWYHEGKCWSPK